MERSGLLIKKKDRHLKVTSPASKADQFNFQNMDGELLLKLTPAHASIIFFLLMYIKTHSHYTICLVYITLVLLSLEV